MRQFFRPQGAGAKDTGGISSSGNTVSGKISPCVAHGILIV